MKRPLISDEWIREYDGPNSSGIQGGIMLSPLTFCGALEEFYEPIARYWDDTTRIQYDRDYNNTILPHINNHNCKTISEYSKNDCEEILDGIRSDGYINQGKKKEYSESRMNHFKNLIYTVFDHASRAGMCKDFLWGTKFEIDYNRKTLALKTKTQLKRSLTIKQEKVLIEQLLEMPDEDGTLVALLLMFSLGLRDGEACGLDFGDLYELPYNKDCYVAMVKQTTIPKSSMLQSSGKTWNSGRRIPIPSKVLEFILQRKKLISDIIFSKGLDIDINRLPVACKGYIDVESENFKIRLKANDVTEAAKNIFKQVGIDSEILASLEIEMDEENARLEVSESNVTAYLLRRNFATHLKILGLDYPDIQYLLGHCIEDPYINRPDYTDSKLYELMLQMENRPLVNYEKSDEFTIPCFYEKRFKGNKTLHIQGKYDCIKVKIYAAEKNDQLKVKIPPNSAKGKKITIREDYKAYEPHKIINIVRKYKHDYK